MENPSGPTASNYQDKETGPIAKKTARGKSGKKRDPYSFNFGANRKPRKTAAKSSYWKRNNASGS
jgi:hypothetical protein